ncbi:MAG TPA: VCBS repeat-containing protein [Thermoanaerobaculia bacterium]|jgi:hypothetical protein
MYLRKSVGFVLSVVMLASTSAVTGADAQSAAAKKPAATAVAVPDGGVPRYIRPETPEQRQERLGTQTDPGPDPDPKTEWFRFGQKYTIHKFDKKWVRPGDRPGWVQAHPNVNFTDEMYQENDKWVWVWIPEPKPRRSTEERREALQYGDYSQTAIDYLQKIRDEYSPLEPPRSATKVRFEESSTGLPTSGSFRNSLAVADMNNDGRVDLVIPSQRGSGSGTPTIYLGDGKGGWKRWDVKWPHRIDYGSVAVADFNKDKNMDVAFGIHLKGVEVHLGDGKGNFTAAYREGKFPSRRVLTTDVDGDGWMDVVAMWEGPIARGQELRDKTYSGLRAYLNRDKGKRWEGVNISERKYGISGDWLAAANFNGDKRPDFVGSTLYFNSTHTVFMSDADGGKYSVYDDPEVLVIPARGTYHAVTAGPFSVPSRDDAIVASVRKWPEKLDPKLIPPPPLSSVVALDRISFAGGTPKRTPILRFGPGRSIAGLGHGDFDRDGKQDIVFTRHDPREAVVLLGDGKGGFSRAETEGLIVAPQRNYDLTVADVNGDSRPDVIVMYEADSATALSPKNGSVQVFLNRGVAK